MWQLHFELRPLSLNTSVCIESHTFCNMIILFYYSWQSAISLREICKTEIVSNVCQCSEMWIWLLPTHEKFMGKLCCLQTGSRQKHTSVTCARWFTFLIIIHHHYRTEKQTTADNGGQYHHSGHHHAHSNHGTVEMYIPGPMCRKGSVKWIC